MLRPLIIAHRGEPGRRENTLAGFLAGLRRGAGWIGLDVHRTAGGPPAVPPTLEEVLEAVPGRVGLGIEIKAPGIGRAVRRALARHRALERALVSSFHWPTVRAPAD